MVAVAFLVFRIFVRIRSFKTLYVDDVLVIVAWALMLANSIVWQSQKNALYAQYEFAAGKKTITPYAVLREQRLLRCEFISFLIFYCSLWCIKLSILLFFRRLHRGQIIKRQKTWWWCVLGFTVATWVLCVGLISYQCLLRPFKWIFRKYR